jgi:anti-sigma28 factor (negative regulator of flagellin synthesis)
MKINGSKDPISQAGAALPIREGQSAPVRPKPEEAAPAAPKRDSVEISAEGRAKAQQAVGHDGSTLSAERSAEIRTKILQGAYNTADMAGEVAKKILNSGDL